MTVTAEWAEQTIEVAQHAVTYEWTGLPEGATLYAADGTVVTPAVPVDDATYVKGQNFDVKAYDGPAVVYTHDEFGNQTASYTLGAWSLSGQQQMGDSDVTVTAEWAEQTIEVAAWNITVTVENGTASVGNTTVVNGADFNTSFAANENHILESVTVDDQPTVLNEDGTYNLTNVTADHAIHVVYTLDVITDPNNDNNGDENPGDGIPDKYQAVVNYESANDAQGTVNLAQKIVTFANNATSGTVNIFDGVATNPTAGFVFDGWTEDGNAVASNLTRELQGNTEYTFIANWALDVIGTDPTDPGNNAPDGIADKYQLVVTYAAIAGTIDGPARYVLNKYDAAGNLAEDGVAVLTAAQIPGATADDGYGNGVWNNEPLANMELTDDTAFVIAFTALPAAAVVVPPLAPVAAAAPAAAAAAAATILDDGVPLATIDDDENALAAFEEIHCWTHWLMIFGALVTIVYGLAVLYRRRHGIRDMDDFEGDITGGRKYDAAAERNPAAGNAFQAM